MHSSLTNSKLLTIFINEKLLINRNACFSKGLHDLPSLPEPLLKYQNQIKPILVESEYGQHYVLNIKGIIFDHSDFELLSLRTLLTLLNEQDFQLVAQSWQYGLFLNTHRFCGRCGYEMRRVTWEMACHCDKCAHRAYPRVSPCIIVAIYHQNKILLAQGPRQKERDLFSTLAGFVESAESLEQAVHREVFEEVGVIINELEYITSQPWPFPHSLMCGFVAKYKENEIKVDGKEILEAHWFDIDALPNVPEPWTIAGRLIAETKKRIEQNSKN